MHFYQVTKNRATFMASIQKLLVKGKVTWRAAIKKTIDGKQIRRSKNFETKKGAEAWVSEFEKKLDNPLEIRRIVAESDTPTLEYFIRWYIDAYQERSDWKRSKQSHLELLMTFDISDKQIDQLTATDFIDHIALRLKSCKPATANNDLIWIRVVIKSVMAHFPSVLADTGELEKASTYLRQNKMIGKPKRRDRRPSTDELNQLDAYFQVKDEGSTLKCREVMWFAVQTCRRQAEITRLLWSDYNKEKGTMLVRNVKHPTKKDNHKTCRLTRKAQEIIDRQPKTDKRIFPFDSKTIGNYFTRACKLCEIEDLRFHDLRHEATSRLFEQGYSIVEVQQFSLHESWQELSRYTNLRPENVDLKDDEELSDIRVIQLIKDSIKLPDSSFDDVFTIDDLRDRLTISFGSDIAADALIEKFKRQL